MQTFRVAVVAVFIAVAAATPTVMNMAYDSTSCTFTSGSTTIDLSSIATNTGPIMTSSSWYQYFTPCNTLTYSTNMPDTQTLCTDTSMACTLSGTTPTSARPYALTANKIEKSTYDSTQGTLAVHYTGGAYCPNQSDYRQMTVTYKCAETDSTPVFVNEDQCHFFFTYPTKAACPIPPATAAPTTAAPTTPAPTTPTPTMTPTPFEDEEDRAGDSDTSDTRLPQTVTLTLILVGGAIILSLIFAVTVCKLKKPYDLAVEPLLSETHSFSPGNVSATHTPRDDPEFATTHVV